MQSGKSQCSFHIVKDVSKQQPCHNGELQRIIPVIHLFEISLMLSTVIFQKKSQRNISRNICSTLLHIEVADSCHALPNGGGGDEKVEWNRESFRISFPRQDQLCSYLRGVGEFANDGQASVDLSV